MPRDPGTLYLVPTPLGNLGDITDRAREVLSSVPLVACEDTRRVRKLLGLLEIPAPRLLSCFEHNEEGRVRQILAHLAEGQDAALASDAGTPTISDPGYRLVTACVEADVTVVSLPGPCAAITALAASGLPTDRFLFMGFPPRKQGKTMTFLREAAEPGRTAVLYAPLRRLPKLLARLTEVAPDARVVIGRELTKMHEQYLRGTARELSEMDLPVRGECTVVIYNPPTR